MYAAGRAGPNAASVDHLDIGRIVELSLGQLVHAVAAVRWTLQQLGRSDNGGRGGAGLREDVVVIHVMVRRAAANTR